MGYLPYQPVPIVTYTFTGRFVSSFVRFPGRFVIQSVDPKGDIQVI